MKRCAVITGVTSFLGAETTKKLLDKGFFVYGIIRPESRRLNNIKNIIGLKKICIDFDKYSCDDIRKIANLKLDILNKIDDRNIDTTFIHFGWGSTLDRNNRELQEKNIDYSLKVIEFANAIHSKRFIFAGSQAEYSNTAYGLAKMRFGEIAEAYSNSNINFIHFRIFSIYGFNDRKNSLLKSLVYNIKNNIDMKLSKCDYLWNYLYIADFVEIVYKFIINDADSGIYDIASNDTRLLYEYVLETYRVLNGKNKLFFGEIENKNEKFAIPDISNLLKVIGKYNFTKFNKGVANI